MKFTAGQLAALINGTVEGDAGAVVNTYSKIEEAHEGSLTFLANPKYTHYIYTTDASVVLVSNDFVAEHEIKATLIRVEDPYATLAQLLNMAEQMLNPRKRGIEQPSFVSEGVEFFKNVPTIARHLNTLEEVGLGYIKLGQSSSTLSGGENQRVKLAYYLGIEKHEPTVFIFDEPTTGLHFHDIRRLLDAFNALIMRGHTLIIIEHNLDVIKCADHVIDLGPEGGARGGQLLCCGTPEVVAQCRESYTARFLKEKLGMVQ